MRKEAIGIMVAVLVASSLGVGYLAGNSATRTDTATSISTVTSTSTLVSTTTSASSATNQTATDCNSVNGPGSYAVYSSIGLQIGMPLEIYRQAVAYLNASVLAPVPSRTLGGAMSGYAYAGGVTITPSIPSVNVTALGNGNNFNVTYTINASSGVRGFFVLEYLDSCPTMIPLAVGYTASQLSAKSFLYYQPFQQACSGSGMLQGGDLMSVSGIQMAWLVQTVQGQNSTLGTQP